MVELLSRHQKHSTNILMRGRKTDILKKNVLIGKKKNKNSIYLYVYTYISRHKYACVCVCVCI